MLTKRETTITKIMIVVQVIVSILMFFVPEYIYGQQIYSSIQELLFIAQIIPVWSFFLKSFQLGIIFRENSFLSMIRGYAITVGAGTALLLLEVIVWPPMRHHSFSISYILCFGVLDLLGLILFKTLFYYTMRFMRSNGYNSRNVIIIADTSAVSFIETFIKTKDWGYRLEAIVSPDSLLQDKYAQVQPITDQEELKEYITLHPIDDIFYCLPINGDQFNIGQLIRECDEIGVSLHIRQPLSMQVRPKGVVPEMEFNHTFITHQTVPGSYIGLKIKDTFDLFFSVIALIATSPIMLLLAAAIKLSDGGPVLFKQERIGKSGRRFICYKFRSMVENADELKQELMGMNEMDGPAFKIENDPRITPLGHIMRKTYLDELPQFINVIKGEMSIVGPRPPLLSEVKQYDRPQLRRLSMRPGLTCTWQVWGYHQVSFEEWMKMDMEYIDNWSLKLDAKILLATIGVMLKANGK